MKSSSPRSDNRGRLQQLTLARFVPAPENQAALLAIQSLATCVASRRSRRLLNPLFLHGPPGTGKTHLVWALAHEVARSNPERTVAFVSAADIGRGGEDPLVAAYDCDLVVLEDLQHLPPGASAATMGLIDSLVAHQQQLVCTASVGPGRLVHLPERLTSRLGAGLVVGIEPLSAASRLLLLQDRAERRQLAVPRDVLAWLADHLTGGRQLDGALNRLEKLLKVNTHPLDVETVADIFREQVDAGRPTIDRIAQRVGRHFHVEPRQLQSRRRSRDVLLPRQVGMYLARKLTGLSLTEIGKYFGGRDHSTVLHACRKISTARRRDAVLGGTLRQLRAELT
jgi:chromosomal replication initiator protein